jgi:hypothetical protein
MVVFFHQQIIYPMFMMNLPPRNLVLFDCPATYQINVHGKINPAWSDRLEGMTISLAAGERGEMTTILEGELNDQAALAGVLNTLYEQHLTLFLVKRLEI